MKVTRIPLVFSSLILISVSFAFADPFVDRVISFAPGSYLFGTVPPAPGDELKVLGPPDGLLVALGLEGEIVLEFVDNVVIDGPGDDLQINVFLPGSGSQELDNEAQVLLSNNGVSFRAVPGTIGVGGPSFSLDLSTIGFTEARFVKIVDSGSCCLSGNPTGGGDGFNLESVEALNTAPANEICDNPQPIENQGELRSCSRRVATPNYEPLPNGCGPEWIPERFLRQAGFDPNNPAGGEGTSFEQACNNHDLCWGTCSGTQNDRAYKLSCDLTLLQEMEDVCSENTISGSTLNEQCRGSAGLYFILVHGAMRYYTAAQVQACSCCQLR